MMYYNDIADLDYALESLDSSIDSLDEAVLENDLMLFDAACEGAGLEATKFSIRYRKKFKELRIRKRIAELQLKMGDFKSLRQNISELRDITMEIKETIDRDIPEPKNGWGSFCSVFAPIFSGMAREEVTGAYMVGNTVVISSNVYTDAYSKATKNGGKRGLQEAMNYFLKQLRDIDQKMSVEEKRAQSKENAMSDNDRKKLEEKRAKILQKIKKYEAKIEAL